ncbi:nocobactin polyketide synthase NbtC [Mycobacterium bourgelatii]|uniref:Putative polyketide synthase MbtD n=1 Tax=Mycobacterium bourgelatii TaxID=1273442 RepID=A0A7I9YSW4_MYCBU|nr:nocobactin polyketide synthase NbtC [Mycobacterium bourgelatii]MCV6978472.1 nocobactin polyketide synthase NbtC [Mycobacterium bourgelatii]GFG91726.1 putative polyketide synthase MbtD [Mycobacterium bourgelatii]
MRNGIPLTYRLPNRAIPVLLSADTPQLLSREAEALLAYAADHSEVTPQAVADMLFRTRLARRHRALAIVTDRAEFLAALGAIADDREHHSVIRAEAAARRPAYVFPGQGGQRPGMGKLFYEAIPAFREEADRCAAAFAAEFDDSPLNYLLDEDFPAQDDAATVQPALFIQMAALAAMWRSFGIQPHAVIGHSQGEIAAAYVAGLVSLADAVSVVGIRARAADEFAADDYAMAVIAADRDTCEDLLARSSGWAQLSVVNSPNMTGISGDRESVLGIVDALAERGTFARVIRVQYPAHTSLINQLGDKVRASAQRKLQNTRFLDTEIDCLGATLGGPIPADVPADQYWFWNLRNTVRFDKAISAAAQRGIDTFVELAEHPTLQLAIQENLAASADGDDVRAGLVVGTSQRTATNLDEFTRSLAQLAVHDLNYRWECLGTEYGGGNGPIPLPLIDFPNAQMNESYLWMPYDLNWRSAATTAAAQEDQEDEPADELEREVSPRLFVEEWIRLSQRSLVPPRAIGIVDYTGRCSALVDGLCAAAAEVGASARVLDGESGGAGADLNTLVILVPSSPKLDVDAAADEVAAFFGNRAWWPALPDSVTDCWLVTVGGEAVVAEDAPPDLVQAAAAAGFRSVGAEYPGVGFRHLDLPAAATDSASAQAILSAVHTGEEPELAFRDGGLYAKRIVDGQGALDDSAPDRSPEHVLIIGGTGNLGLEFCDHYARRGARQITLVSRSGETAAVADRLRQIRSATSALIQVASCDVGDHAAVARLAAEHQDRPADLIIHAAVNYSAVDFHDVTVEAADQALRAKVVGAWRVLNEFPRTNNCRVVLCSSARATIGGRGQVVYAAANRMLDAMAHQLRAAGLDCAAVQWGQWTVHFDLDAANTAALEAIGVIPMTPAAALAVGMRPLRSNAIVLAFNFARARPILEAFGYGPLISRLDFDDIDEPVTGPDDQDVPERLLDLLAQAIGTDRAEAIDTTAPMVALGLDSLQALELRRRVRIEFNHDLEVADLLGGASLADVLAKLGGQAV